MKEKKQSRRIADQQSDLRTWKPFQEKRDVRKRERKERGKKNPPVNVETMVTTKVFVGALNRYSRLITRENRWVLEDITVFRDG